MPKEITVTPVTTGGYAGVVEGHKGAKAYAATINDVIANIVMSHQKELGIKVKLPT